LNPSRFFAADAISTTFWFVLGIWILLVEVWVSCLVGTLVPSPRTSSAWAGFDTIRPDRAASDI
jgi:hypothetical protein